MELEGEAQNGPWEVLSDGFEDRAGDTEPLCSPAPHATRAKASQLILGPRNYTEHLTCHL